jgi:hypothetical protein
MADTGVRRSLIFGQLLCSRNDSLIWRALLIVTPGVGSAVVDYEYSSSSEGTFDSRLLSLYEEDFSGLACSAGLKVLMTEMIQLLDN